MAGTEVPPAARWQQEFAADPACVGEIRRGLTSFARAHGVPDALVADLALAVSEAATNAVVHAFAGATPGRLQIRAAPLDGAFEVAVADDGRGMRPRGDSPGLGLGLPTIAQLTRSFDIRDGLEGRGTEVCMVFDAPGVAAAAGAPDPEAWRYELLAEVTRIAGATGWPGEGVDELVELLVPRIADAAVLDLVEPDGPRRVAARVGDDPGGALARWLLGRRPPGDAVAPAIPGTRAADVHVTALDRRTREALVLTEEDPDRLERLGLATWVTVPLGEGGVVLGTLGLGLRPGRPDPAADLAFYGALGERAARGLASTHLVEELRRTRRRLERILSVLSEAVTVQDAGGRIVYANEAATRLLGMASVDEILATEPGELAARFTITGEDGTPVALDDLPGSRVLRGAREAALLTRSVHRASGEEHWLLTKATLLEDGEPFAVNIIEDITEAKTAELRRRVLAEAAAALAAAGDRDAALAAVAALAVPAVADRCAITVGGALVAEAGAPAEPHRSALTVPIAEHAELQIATQPQGRVLTGAHATFAAELAARIAPALAG